MKRKKKPIDQTEQEEHIRRMALFKVMAGNVLSSRVRYGNTTTFDGLRDVYDTLGYPSLDKITYSDYYTKYRRQDIASRIIEKPVDSSWRMLPIVSAAGDDNDKFREAWEELESELKIYSTLIRADTVSRIGRYGALVLGFNDQAEFLSEPVERATELLYLQPFSEENAQIKTYVQNKNDPRYGLPETYSLKTAAFYGDSSAVATEVHHSRVIHIAENLLEGEMYALPPLERVYNRLLNLELIVGGSAEMFWQGAFPGLAFSASKDTDISELDTDALNEEIQKYVHQMERYMKLQGLDITNLAPAVADPTAHVDVQLKMISIATNIPKRILEGSERGELSSSQDTEAWDAFCNSRRNSFCEPVILRPLIDRLVDVGVLDEPKDGVAVEWPDLSTPSDKDRAEIGRIRSEALSKYLTNPDAQMVLPFEQFLLEIMEIPDEKVDRIIDAMEDNLMSMQLDDGQGDDEYQEEMENLDNEVE